MVCIFIVIPLSKMKLQALWFFFPHAILFPKAAKYRQPSSQVGIISGEDWTCTFHCFSTTGAKEQEKGVALITSRP